MYYENQTFDIKLNSHPHGHLACKLHLHYHVEIVYMEKGECTAIVDGKEYTLKSDSLLIVFPNKPHAYESYTDENYMISIATPNIMKEIVHLFDTREPITPIIENVSSLPDLYEILKLLKGISNDGKMTTSIEKIGYSISLFGLIFRYLPTKKTGVECSKAMRTIIDFCAKNYNDEISLSVLSNELHMSKYYISHLFGKEFNMKFNDYVNSLRVSAASRLLCDTSKSITEISAEVGFSTARTFNRAFSKQYGISPTEYRISAKNKING